MAYARADEASERFTVEYNTVVLTPIESYSTCPIDYRSPSTLGKPLDSASLWLEHIAT